MPTKPSLAIPLRIKITPRLLKHLKKAREALHACRAQLCIPDPEKTLFLLQIQDSIASGSPRPLRIDTVLSARHLKKKTAACAQVLRCQAALEYGLAQIHKAPLASALLQRMHALIEGNPHSSFRTTQNWIGPTACTIAEAYAFPPPPTRVAPLMRALERYAKRNDQDPLLQLAILFGQFLKIHPFRDGNGRIARLLVPLFLAKKKILPHPILFCSRYLRAHRRTYFTKMFTLCEKNDWPEWICFFLNALTWEARATTRQLEKGHSSAR